MGIRFDGLSTGLDTTALIDALMNVERRPLAQNQARQSTIRSQQDLFRELNTRLLALRDAALAIDNRNSVQTGPSLDEEFLAYTATSADESFLRAESNGSVTPGEIDVRIDQVAQAGREISNGFADPASTIASSGQTLQIDVGGTQLVDFNVGAGGASLQDIRDAINTDSNNDGSVRAEILFDGTDHRLILSSNQTGATQALTITTNIDGPAGAGTPLFDPALTQTAQDAVIQVFGLSVTRGSNEITDVVPGVTLRLERAHDPGDLSQSTVVDVARDDENIEEKIQALVDAYNSVQEFTAANASYDATSGQGGLLIGDSTLLRISGNLRQTLFSSYSLPANPLTSLSQLGVRFDRDGRLDFDAKVLRDALDEDPLAARELLMGDGQPNGLEGAATAIGTLLEPITRSGDGSIAIRIDGFEDQISSLDQTIERMERRLAQREESLIFQFSRLETLVSNLQAQGNFLTTAFARAQQ